MCGGKRAPKLKKHAHIYQNEKERKNDITDSILSQKQHMTRTGIEHYVNKRREGMSVKEMCCKGEEKNDSEDTRHR